MCRICRVVFCIARQCGVALRCGRKSPSGIECRRRGLADSAWIFESDFVGVVDDLDDFGVAGAAGADLFVSGLVDGAAAVAGDDGLHAAEALVDGFAAPEAAFAERGGF